MGGTRLPVIVARLKLIFVFLGVTSASVVAFEATSQCPPHVFSAVPECPPAVDDRGGLGAGSWKPWTYRPLCRETLGVKYCVYTSTLFNEGKGLSIIASPEVAITVAGRMESEQATWQAKKHLGVSKATSRSRGLSYELQELPQKGVGVVARRPIRRGELIMTGFPAIIVDNEYKERLESIETRKRGLYDRALAQLPDKERVSLLAQSGEGHIVQDIMRTNAHGVLLDGRNFTALYPEIARLNHACKPNGHLRFSNTTLSLEIVALRDISTGEEIQISYIPLGLPSAERRELIRSIFGFKCLCSLCTASREEKAASDTRRRRIYEIEDILTAGEASHHELLQMTAELLVLVQEEELTPHLKWYYHDLMRVYHEFGDYESAMVLAQEGLRWMSDFESPEDSDGLREAFRLNIRALKTYPDAMEA